MEYPLLCVVDGKTKTPDLGESELKHYATCIEPYCSMYLSTVCAPDAKGRCEGKRGDKHGACMKSLVELDDEAVQDLVPDNRSTKGDEKDPGPVRRLRALIAKAESWIGGSGTHHRSTGGPHTSGAQEKHSGAHASKSLVRDRYADQLIELATEVNATYGKTYASLVKQGQDTAKKVKGK
ncbi:MAG: hypothetical protein ACRDX9_11915 [Acidimicrobiia bacterium]